MRLHPVVVAAGYLVLDVICVGLGMGVPLFCILLGFPVGVYLTLRVWLTAVSVRMALRRVWFYSAAAALVTFVLMAGIWGSTQLPMLGDPTADLANFGIPMILYTPLASFIGWLVLMVLVAPFLQLVMALFASYVTLALRLES
jgi:hypothetical protein